MQSSEDVAWDLLDTFSIACDHLRALVQALELDFRADDGGYRQLSDLSDPIQRAVVSDQICQSACAVRSNLLEARLHQRQLDDIVGSEGVRFPDKATARDTLVRGAEMDMAITGCVRALTSALDCAAAAAIGILRIPFPIQRASFTQLPGVLAPRVLEVGTATQQSAWREMADLIDRHERMPPAGWSGWLAGMRNLNVHRARQVHILLQRLREPGHPQVAVVAADPMVATKNLARFDLHLRRRPQLPDMQDFISTSETGDLWINEPATTTIPGIFLPTNALVEDLFDFLLAKWHEADARPTAWPAPATKWEQQAPPATDFAGVAPRTEPFPADFGITSPHLAERLKLAQRLRTMTGGSPMTQAPR